MKQLNAGNRRHYYRNAAASRAQQQAPPPPQQQQQQPPPPVVLQAEPNKMLAANGHGPPPPPTRLGHMQMDAMPGMMMPGNEAETGAGDLLANGGSSNSSLFVPNPGKISRRLAMNPHSGS